MPECDACGRELELVRERGREKHYRCPGCGAFSTEVDDKAVEVSAVLSREELSEHRRISVPGDGEFAVGGVLVLDGRPCRIKKVESGGRSVERAAPRDTTCVWLVDITTIRVRLSIRLARGKTRSIDMESPPDATYAVGQVLDLEGLSVVVLAIGTEEHTLRRGSATAESIRALFCRVVR